MRKFEEGLKEKAHLSKIRQAKTTISSATKPSTKLTSSKLGAEAQLLLDLYDGKNFDSIPAYKLLRTAGLQQYTRGFIQRGYGINLGRLALISEDEKRLLYEELKILPGHTVKLDRIIDSLAKSSEGLLDLNISREPPSRHEEARDMGLASKDAEYDRQLERVLQKYTPQPEMRKKVPASRLPEQKNTVALVGTGEMRDKYSKTKYSSAMRPDFRKKTGETSSKPTIKKGVQHEQNKRESLARLLQTVDRPAMSAKRVLEINM